MLETLLLALIVLFVMITLAAYATYAERRICAFIQQRKGPNRVGPLGLLQPAADGLKLLLKESIVPADANHFIHFLSPVITVILAVSGLAILPFAKGVQVFDANIGILYTLAVASISVYGVSMAGWASNSKYALLGGLRSSAQMISYELSMGISVVSVVLLTNHFYTGAEYLRLSSIVEAQKDIWFVFINPLGFIIFFTCALAETNRAPFDLAEAEQELVAGFHTEYSGMKFGSFYVGEYLNVLISAGIISTLFFGGYHGPFEGLLGVDQWGFVVQTAWGVSWFLAKILFFVFVFIWIRWTLPRFKYNQLMNLGWRYFLPLSILNLMILALILTIIQ